MGGKLTDRESELALTFFDSEEKLIEQTLIDATKLVSEVEDFAPDESIVMWSEGKQLTEKCNFLTKELERLQIVSMNVTDEDKVQLEKVSNKIISWFENNMSLLLEIKKDISDNWHRNQYTPQLNLPSADDS